MVLAVLLLGLELGSGLLAFLRVVTTLTWRDVTLLEHVKLCLLYTSDAADEL